MTETYYTWRMWIEIAGMGLALALLLYLAVLFALIRVSDRVGEPWRSRLIRAGMVMTLQGRRGA